MTQLPLLSQPNIQPLRASAGHYLVVLKNLKGERRALAEAHETVWDRMTPLFESPGRRKPKGLVLNRPTISDWVKGIAEAVGSKRFVFLDFPLLSARHVVSTAQGDRPALLYAFEACRRRGLMAIWA